MSFGETVVAPSGRLNQASRLISILDKSERRIRRRYLRLVEAATQLETLEGIATLMEAGRTEEALALLTEDLAPALASSLDQVYSTAGLSAAEVLRGTVDTLFDFNMANARAIADLRQTRLRLVREFTSQQRRATSVFLQDAFERGLAPVNQARALKRSIGLTEHQSRAVVNFRQMLENRDATSLTRVLRDKRFDPSIRRSIRTGQPLSQAQINRMTERYRQRFIQHRAKTIAKTESLRAANGADEAFWQDAIDNGVIPADALSNFWRTSMRANRRDWHRVMEGQKRAFGVPFRSGRGNDLRFPGDPDAPANDTINCNCVIQRKIDKARAQAGGTRLRRAA